MSEQVLIQFKADKELYEDVSKIYEELGLDLPTALRMFMTQCVLVRGIPFEVKLPDDCIST